MIDGLKIRVENLNTALWIDHVGLDFSMSVSQKTGEVLTEKPYLANCKGLTFKLTPTQKDPSVFTAHVLGSLHRFKNEGEGNADNFTYTDIVQTVENLSAYHIDPSVTMLENIEFGVNIALPYSCELVLNSMISSANRRFVEMKFEGVQVGKRLSYDRFEFKIYDKGKVETGKKSNLLRVELRVKKMNFLNKTVVTLEDLTDKTKLQRLGAILTKRLQTVVMYGAAFTDIEKYPLPTQNKIYQWTNSNYWDGLEPLRRFREQKAFDALQESTGAGRMKAFLMGAVAAKWDELLNLHPSVSRQKAAILESFASDFYVEKLESVLFGESVLETFAQTFEVEKMPTVSELPTVLETFAPSFDVSELPTVSPIAHGFRKDCPIKINGTFIKEQQQGGRKNQLSQAGRFCDSCGISIDHKRPQSRFCSDKCRVQKRDGKRDRRKATTDKVTHSVSAPEKTAALLGGLVEKLKM